MRNPEFFTGASPEHARELALGRNENFVVIDITAGKREVIAEVDYASAPRTLYEALST